MKKFLLLFLLFLPGCETPQHYKVNNIVRVFMHDPGKYSLMVREDGQLKSLPFHGHSNYFYVYEDVPSGEPMWADVDKTSNGVKTITLHVHDEKDIQGGGWDHGKFGSGQTQVFK